LTSDDISMATNNHAATTPQATASGRQVDAPGTSSSVNPKWT
jgi:hypothetical protein